MVLINYGEDAGKIAVIVDILDGNKCYIDGLDVARQVIPYKRIALTDLMVEVEKGAHSKTVEAAMTVRLGHTFTTQTHRRVRNTASRTPTRALQRERIDWLGS